MAGREDGKPPEVYSMVQRGKNKFFTEIVKGSTLDEVQFQKNIFTFGHTDGIGPEADILLVSLWDGGWDGDESKLPVPDATDFAGFAEIPLSRFWNNGFALPEERQTFKLISGEPYYQARLQENDELPLDGENFRTIKGGSIEVKVRIVKATKEGGKAAVVEVTPQPIVDKDELSTEIQLSSLKDPSVSMEIPPDPVTGSKAAPDSNTTLL